MADTFKYWLRLSDYLNSMLIAGTLVAIATGLDQVIKCVIKILRFNCLQKRQMRLKKVSQFIASLWNSMISFNTVLFKM